MTLKGMFHAYTPSHVGLEYLFLPDAVIKSRPTAQSQLPYFLPMSPAHFNAMVSGRQKAIEVC